MKPACIAPTGGSQPHENMSPYLVLNFVIALQGIFPSPELARRGDCMSNPVRSRDQDLRRQLRAQGLGALQWPAPADQPEHRAVLAARHHLRRRRQEQLRPAQPAGQHADAARPGPGPEPARSGRDGGEQNVTLLQTEMPAHVHSARPRHRKHAYQPSQQRLGLRAKGGGNLYSPSGTQNNVQMNPFATLSITGGSLPTTI